MTREDVARLCTIPLGREGLDYIETCLRGRGLSAKVRAERLSGGKLDAVVPEGFSLAQARNFPNGTGTSMHHAIAWLAHHLKARLATNPAATILVQDVWAQPGDRDERSEAAWFANNDCLYYPARTENMSFDEADRLIHEPMSFQLVGFVSNYVLPREVLSSHQASDSVIEALARAVTEVFVGAYDQEGFVVWQKD
jgi:hypothetical protein